MGSCRHPSIHPKPPLYVDDGEDSLLCRDGGSLCVPATYIIISVEEGRSCTIRYMLTTFHHFFIPPCLLASSPSSQSYLVLHFVLLSYFLLFYFISWSLLHQLRVVEFSLFFKFLFLSLAFLGFGTGKKCYYGAYQLLLRVAVKRFSLSC